LIKSVNYLEDVASADERLTIEKSSPSPI